MDASALGDPAGTIPRMEVSIFPADETLVRLALDSAKVLEGKQVLEGHIVSGDKFVASDQEKQYLKKQFHGDCVEMEGAAVGHTCYVNKVPFVILRSISDAADDHGSMSYEDFKAVAIENSLKVLEKMIEDMQ